MQKKNKCSLTDFSVENLPKTRKEQFFDLFKHNFGLFFTLGLLLVAFAAPFFASLTIKHYLISNAYSSMGNDTSKYQAFYNSTVILFDAIYIVAFIVIGSGLAGIYRVFRKLCWGQGIHLMHDIGTGIKQNWLKFLIISAIFGVIHLCSDYLKISQPGTVVGYILFALEVILIPSFLMFFIIATIFDLKLGKAYISSIIMCLKRPLTGLLFCLFPIAVSFVSFINYPIVQIVIYLVLFLIIGPTFILCSYLYCLYTIDEYSNKEFKSEYYKKGLAYEFENGKNI